MKDNTGPRDALKICFIFGETISFHVKGEKSKNIEVLTDMNDTGRRTR